MVNSFKKFFTWDHLIYKKAIFFTNLPEETIVHRKSHGRFLYATQVVRGGHDCCCLVLADDDAPIGSRLYLNGDKPFPDAYQILPNLDQKDMTT